MIQRLGVLLRTVAPVFLLCDPRDLGVSERIRDPHFEKPCLFFYDQYPGGIGLSEGFLRDLPRIARGAREVVDNCPCASGCPSCIGAPEEQQGTVNAKTAVRQFLAAWTGALEQAGDAGAASPAVSAATAGPAATAGTAQDKRAGSAG